MPQIDNNVDYICNTIIMKVGICMKSSLKKRLITVPVSHFDHTIISPTNCPDIDQIGCFYLIIVPLFPLTFMHHSLLSLLVCSHVPLLVEKYIHMIHYKKVQWWQTDMKYKLHQVLFLWPLPPQNPFSFVSILLCRRVLPFSAFWNRPVFNINTLDSPTLWWLNRTGSN